MEPVVECRKFVLPEIIFGNGSFELVGRYAEHYGLKKVLLVTDAGVCKAGWTSKVIDCLAASGIACEVFQNVTPNPKDLEVMAGAARYRESDCRGIIALGGGSPMDCAKGIGIVCSNNGHILDYEGIDQIAIPMPPLICIPTTAGTAADISQFAIITDTEERRKIAIISKTLVPDLALVDPLLTTTMDRELTGCTGMDALVHAVEAYVSTAHSVFTDLHALEAIRLISLYLPAVMEDPQSCEAREGMMLASTQAGMAFSNASLGAVHAMAHSLGGVLDSSHGDCNAQLLEHVVAYNFLSAPGRYRRIAECMGLPVQGATDEAARAALVEAIHSLRIRSGIVGTLAGRGVSADIILRLAFNAMHDACMVTNPRRPTQVEIEEIYAKAL